MPRCSEREDTFFDVVIDESEPGKADTVSGASVIILDDSANTVSPIMARSSATWVGGKRNLPMSKAATL
jgi:hypothetical protein